MPELWSGESKRNTNNGIAVVGSPYENRLALSMLPV